MAWTSVVLDSTLIMVRLMPPALLTLQAFFCVLRCISSQPPRDQRLPPPPPPPGDPNLQQNSITGHTTTSTSSLTTTSTSEAVSSTTHSIVATTESTEGTPTAETYPLMGHFFRCHIDECFRCQETQQFTGSHLRCSERCCRTPTCAAYNFRPGLVTSSVSECTLCTIRQNITTEAVEKLGPGCYFCEKVVSIPIQ
ncbi:uncharacterized protein LOC112555426 [Pomacea canaliculata]|uniref:uncharacterized protein LOC112555426 n=1 Tax=Pomacea canaliculata TaxID=400727 RepID=UPI000D73E9F6|nr:uncharacterized protein LOC112555426 [Pomacea canaliculata]